MFVPSTVAPVEQIATDEFRPETYEDTQRKQVRELIERKVQGQEITSTPAPAPKAQIIDLMEALKASLSPAGKPAAQPISLADRKPPKRSPRTADDEAITSGAETKKKSSKR